MVPVSFLCLCPCRPLEPCSSFTYPAALAPKRSGSWTQPCASLRSKPSDLFNRRSAPTPRASREQVVSRRGIETNRSIKSARGSSCIAIPSLVLSRHLHPPSKTAGSSESSLNLSIGPHRSTWPPITYSSWPMTGRSRTLLLLHRRASSSGKEKAKQALLWSDVGRAESFLPQPPSRGPMRPMAMIIDCCCM